MSIAPRFLAVAILCILIWSCNEEELEQPPIVKILSQELNDTHQQFDTLRITVEAVDPGGRVESIKLWWDGDEIYQTDEASFEWY